MLVPEQSRVAIPVREKNAEICASLMAQAAENDVSLSSSCRKHCWHAMIMMQILSVKISTAAGRRILLGRLRRESKRNMMTVSAAIHVPSTPGRAWNMLVALQAEKHCRPLCQTASL